MNTQTTPSPQFYLTAPAACPYLSNELERKVFTHLVGPRAAEMNDILTQGGFRRSQNIAYRPACESCRACVSGRFRAVRKGYFSVCRDPSSYGLNALDHVLIFRAILVPHRLDGVLERRLVGDLDDLAAGGLGFLQRLLLVLIPKLAFLDRKSVV